MLELEIENVRNIKSFNISLPFSKGLYAVTGVNGVGKSTIFSALSKVVYRGALTNYFRNDGNSTSKIVYRLNGVENTWEKRIGWQRVNPDVKDIFVNGVFEGSLIYGNRFSDAHTSKLSSTSKIKDVDICDADLFVKENLGLILRSSKDLYSELKRVKTKKIAESLGFSGIPYLIDRDGVRIHQSKMSSGEFLLIGLLHYIHQRIIYTSRNNISEPSVILLDEIELALHPSAQDRLAIFLNKISVEHNFCIYFATHSIQILSNVRSEKIFHLDVGLSGEIEVINPCYPAYATRCMYTPDGFDFILLVEDDLAKSFVEKSIRDNRLQMSRLIKVLPCGGWEKTLELQQEIQSSRLAGAGCQVISILDGDIQDECNRKYPNNTKFGTLSKSFLPIKSLEKYLKKMLVSEPNSQFSRELGDMFYRVRSLNDIVHDYINDPKSKNDNNGKGLLLVLKKCAIEQGHSEDIFLRELCSFISAFENFDALSTSLQRLCQ
jgi:ABC-type branched-subunit amino acid transport system ATPase component